MPAPKDLVQEVSVSTGTGNFTLSAVDGFVRFSDATHGFGTGGTDVFDYFIAHQTEPEWERGTGHMSDADTLVRDTVIKSTNANAAVSFSAGTKDVVNDVPASRQFHTDAASKTTPVDADSVALVDSEASNAPKRVTGTNLKAYLKTYFDTLYQPLATALTTLATVFSPASASGPASLALHEDTDNGTNKVTIIAPATIASDKTATLQDVTGTIYVTGGTAVAVTDGGTGASTAAAGFDALAPTTTRGDIIVRDASTNTRLAKGNSGDVLTMGANDPAWSAPASSGWTLLTSGTISNSASSLDIVLTSYTSYRALVFVLTSNRPATDNVEFWFRTSTNGGSSYDSGAANYGYSYNIADDGTNFADFRATDTEMTLVSTIGNASNEGISLTLWAYDLANTARYTGFYWYGTSVDNISSTGEFSGGGARKTAADVDAIRFLWSSGNYAASSPGKYAVYGLS